MADADWLTCTNGSAMLSCLQAAQGLDSRKLRLFACACWRRTWDQRAGQHCRRLVEVAEHLADGLVSRKRVRGALARAFAACGETDAWSEEWRPEGWGDAIRVAEVCADSAKVSLERVAWVSAVLQTQAPPAAPSNVALLIDLLAPDRPAPARTAWGGRVGAKFARTVYDERAFGDLPVLADALEEAGCTDHELLAHLRGPEPHFRGCWGLDLLLGRDDTVSPVTST
jgi:hypothetical protein